MCVSAQPFHDDVVLAGRQVGNVESGAALQQAQVVLAGVALQQRNPAVELGVQLDLDAAGTVQGQGIEEVLALR